MGDTAAPCLFCRIVDGDLPSVRRHDDALIIAIEDIAPQAPMHLLVLPRKHIASLNELAAGDDALVGSMVRRAAALAKEHGYEQRGYRTVFNTNREAGQTVFHIHLHVLEIGRAHV